MAKVKERAREKAKAEGERTHHLIWRDKKAGDHGSAFFDKFPKCMKP
jgi:hypothetical protein